ncbi:hypothetical protein F4861DRAFT_340342 [Xylaria intraflava]|nr:hypothetical protein F4861DRAFT_340342 [Xylaria intraflava]
MESMSDPNDEIAYWDQISKRLGELYQGEFFDGDGHEDATGRPANAFHRAAAQNNGFDPNKYDPRITIPHILIYLRDNDASRDADWDKKFPLIQAYLVEAHKQMKTGGLGFGNPKLCAALAHARVMVKIHQIISNRPGEKTPWTDGILHGQTKQARLLTYPKAFPPPEPNRAKSQYRPVRPMPRPDLNIPLWNTSLKISNVTNPDGKIPPLAEVDNYVEGENKFYQSAQNSIPTEKEGERNKGFSLDNEVYEYYMTRGLAETCFNAPPLYSGVPTDAIGPDNPDGTKGTAFYVRRGWQRAALQQCLNIFTNHENRVINTPWRRLVLPYEPPVPLPKEIAYIPRIVEPSEVPEEKRKDPFSWLHWSSQYTRTVDFLAGCQRRRYENQAWGNFSASALPVNFRGPRIYRGLSAHDQHWLKIGETLDNLEGLIHRAWGAAPRPLLRAILRDIDAGRQDNTGGPDIDSSRTLGVDDNDDLLNRKRYWRRDIKRRPGIDNREDNYDDDNYKLVDELDIVWLKYLCEPSRTLEMCDPSNTPDHNLAIMFDAKLQSYFRDLETSGAPDSQELNLWAERPEDIERVMRHYKAPTLTAVLAYINGCEESAIKQSGNGTADPDHPNGSYQFSLEEAEYLCVELSNLGRCSYVPPWRGEPARIDRPKYNVHPEDRVLWRYDDLQQFHRVNAEYLEDMVDYYHNIYGKWSSYDGNRPNFSRELEFVMDHVGPRFPPELERVDVQENDSATNGASKMRRAYIKENLVPEGLCHIGEFLVDSIEFHRESPHQEDLASWEAVGPYLKKFHEETVPTTLEYCYSGDIYQAQTPERTVQFFRNLAYRMGRTMRYAGRIKDRLQYLEKTNGPVTRTPTRPLDLSKDLKKPRPENTPSGTSVQTPAVVEKWWHAISIKDYNLAIAEWNTAIREGSGEVALLPPSIEEVLTKADPRSTFLNSLKGVRDPFTVIREGIIDDCFQNRPTMYPGRLTAFKDKDDKELQGYVRPNLFEWATKGQRRYQAQHTRRNFFNMQRWPPCRVSPHRLEAIRNRKDEVLRTDPSQSDQAHGILTYRLPVGKEKPRYAHPMMEFGHGGHHGHHGNRRPYDPYDPYSPSLGMLGFDGDPDKLEEPAAARDPDIRRAYDDLFGRDQGTDSRNDNDIKAYTEANAGTDTKPYAYVDAGTNTNTGANVDAGVNIDTTQHVDMGTNTDTYNFVDTGANTNPFVDVGFNTDTGVEVGVGTDVNAELDVAASNRGLIPFRRRDEKFAPGPAVFPMGDTLLQKLLISHELNQALYPEQPFYKTRLLGLPKLLHRLAGAKVPLVPLVPPVPRSSIPRSNPGKRKMPIEFLNGSAAFKRFRSDISLPLQPGGAGGQFGAAVGVRAEKRYKGNMGRNAGTGMIGNMPGTGNMRQGTGPQVTNMGGPQKVTNMGEPQQVTNMGQNVQGIAMGATAVPASASLRVYPDPSRKQAKVLFTRAFPTGWFASKVELRYLYSSALIALPFSINNQLAQYNVQTTYDELKKLAESEECAALRPYTKIGVEDNFDIHCLNFLLQTFGEKHNMKLQLGIVQVDPVGPDGDTLEGKGPKNVAYLVGSKYNSALNRKVVWVQVTHLAKFPTSLVNPYSNHEYNSYMGIASKSKRS